ncbi:MAG: hypothetical protein PHP04_10755 [Bacteroidales bacterium]|nr:hypothetical protein [Bacteroidales bacterium]
MNLFSTFPYPKTFSEFKGHVAEWLLIFTCFGYPLQAMMILYSGYDSTPVNILFRAGYLFISLCLVIFGIISTLKQGRHTLRLNLPLVAFLIFWFVYGFRLVYDLEWKEWKLLEYHKYYVYAWAFGSSLIPALAILMNGRFMVAERLTKRIFWFFMASVMALAGYLVFFSGLAFNELLTSHYELFLSGKLIDVERLPVELKRASGVLINSITLSFYGALMGVMATAWFLFYQRRISIWYTFVLVVALIAAIFLLIVGASRGPLLMFLFLTISVILVSIGYFLFCFTRFIFTAIRKYLDNVQCRCDVRFSLVPILYKWMMLLTGLLMIFTAYRYSRDKISINTDQLAMKQRFMQMVEYDNDYNSTIRIDMWKSALHQFKTNPVFGDSFINNVGMHYTHNIFMDVLMSVGVVGSIPFIIYLLAPFVYFIRLPSERKRSVSVLFVIFLAFLMLYMTSGGLFTAAEFWILSAAVIGLSQKYLLNEERTN